MKVIDSSALVKYFSKEEGWDKVREIILEGTVSLDISVKEVANALWRKVLNREIKLKDAEEILRDLCKSNAIKIQDQSKYLVNAFKTAIKNRVTIYDSLFIELSKDIKAELVTSNIKQAQIAKKEKVKTILIL